MQRGRRNDWGFAADLGLSEMAAMTLPWVENMKLSMTLLNCVTSVSLLGASSSGNQVHESLTIADDGVGPIRDGMRFDLRSLRELLPGYTVTAGISSTEGEGFPVIRVMHGEHELLVINPSSDRSSILSVVTRSSAVRDAFGGRIGATYANIFAEREPEGCDPGMEEYSGTVSCPAPGSSRVRYVFRGVGSGPDGAVPPLEELRSWTVWEIAWLPQKS